MSGSGLRIVPPQTALFESVADMDRRVSPDAVFMFNSGPGTNWEVRQRNLKRLQRLWIVIGNGTLTLQCALFSLVRLHAPIRLLDVVLL
ncbi:uncharacterized protein M421DRAFT_417499 [Didymella exigua CBS 183.55]|uniref:Uncharacterized protein n=1 Tax=Didymella exigua CBS 183.55 TaxID=1150837 RepID=A0A6A5RVX0_9PLEO|nr:uncharacterized protein M421DRAFT_417499 [Didymella exigua CBS 183.55]KAF1931739.1 hypothetical protein M421DRAFT_417499 [Didymella exigua CBS 183.55]